VVLDRDQLLRLYDIENRNVHGQLDLILKIRATMAIAFTAILSATLISRIGLIATLGGITFLGAWWWEYVYARYLNVYIDRVGQLRSWLMEETKGVFDLWGAYDRGYDHRFGPTIRLAKWLAKRTGKPKVEPFVTTFLDLPRMVAYLAMALSMFVLPLVLHLPWPG